MLKELFVWMTVLICIVVGIALSAMAAGFLFGVFVKFSHFAFFLT